MKIPPLAACLATLALAGCAHIPKDRDWPTTQAMLDSHSSIPTQLSPQKNSEQQIDEWLNQAVDADTSVRIALLNNPKLRTLYAELGLAQADVYDASRLTNPTLGYLQLSVDGHITKSTWSLTQRFTELLFLRFNTRSARSQLLQTQQRLAHEVLKLEADVRTAHYRYVSARLIQQMRQRVTAAATASVQFAQQLHQAGNISELQLSREQAAASAAKIADYKAVSHTTVARSALLELLGLPADIRVDFIERLELPAAQTFHQDVLQTWALEQRLDLAAARESLNTAQKGLTHTRRWRWLGGMELGAERERESNRIASGPKVSGELPIFNRGGGVLLRAQANVEALEAQIATLELSVRSDVLARLAEVEAARQIVAEYRRQLVPLHRRIVALSRRQNNFMLIGAFELLAARREELDVYQSYLESIGDYWIAHAELARAAGGRLPESAPRNPITLSADDLTDPAEDPSQSSNETSEQGEQSMPPPQQEHRDHAGERP